MREPTKLRIVRMMKTVCLIALTTASLSCSQDEQNTLQSSGKSSPLTIAVSRTMLSSPFYIASEKGYFAAEGLDVQIKDVFGGNKALAQVLKGEADMATVSDTPIMLKLFSRDDYTVITTFTTSSNNIKIIGQMINPSLTITALAGKKVAVVPGTASHFFLDLNFLAVGLDSDDVTLVGMGPQKMQEALRKKQVDAVSVWEPFASEIKTELGSQVAFLDREESYRITFNMVVTNEFAKQNERTLKRALTALDKAITFMHANPNTAQEIVAQKVGLEQDLIEAIWPGLNFGLRLDQEFLITLEDGAKWALAKKLVEEATLPNYFRIINMAPLLKVKPSAVTMIH